jgi:hypothetical protein
VNAPVASGDANPSSQMQLSGSSPTAAHWLIWRNSSVNPLPVAVTVCPWTSPSGGETVSVGGTTSVAGSNASGNRAALAGSRLLPCATTSSHAPAARQSTDPALVSMTA